MKTSNTLKNVMVSSGGSSGPTESVNMSTPSIVACATDSAHEINKIQPTI
jgi:hypothetical protein